MSDKKRPTIYIYCDESCNKIVYEMLAGIEEEGLFSELHYKKIDDVLLKAYQASQNSVLGIGVCLSTKTVAVHVTEMKKNQPLFMQEYKDSDLRTIGCNCARYIKGLPFKEV